MSSSASTSTSPSSEVPEILHADSNYVVGTWEHYALVVWRTEINAPGIAMWSRAMTQLKQQRPGQRFGVVVFIEPACSFGGSGSSFDAAVEALKRFEDVHAGTAIVYNREGFWSATMRCRITAIYHEGKSEVPYAMRASLAEACDWLKEGAPDLGVKPAALARVMETLRAAR